MNIVSLTTRTPQSFDVDRGVEDANVGIRELEALRHFDEVAPAAAAGPAEGLVRTYRGEVSDSDHLRLPPPRNSDAFAVHGALARIASGAPKTDDPREMRMREALSSFDAAVRHIQRLARNDP
jgi:hypothetical protein